MLTVEDDGRIRRAHRDGMSIRAIARTFHHSRHKSLKTQCVRPRTLSTLDEARRAVADFVAQYNTRRLHSAIGYVTPRDKLEGRAEAIHEARDRKLAAARQGRQQRRQSMRLSGASESTEIERTLDVWEFKGMLCVSQSCSDQTERAPVVPEPRPSPPAGGRHGARRSRPEPDRELLNTRNGLSNSR